MKDRDFQITFGREIRGTSTAATELWPAVLTGPARSDIPFHDGGAAAMPSKSHLRECCLKLDTFGTQRGGSQYRRLDVESQQVVRINS